MRSTNLDNWNLNYLRNMRVGGNKAAKEYFSKNGGSRYLSSSANAKEKYTSAVAKKYLQELARLSSADARKYPGEEALTLEAPSLGAKSDSDSNLSDISSSNNSSDDFFSSWDRPLVKKPTPPVSRSATPINRNSSPLTKSAAKPADAAATTTTSRIVPAAKKSNILGTRKTGNSSILNTKKPKFVAKKVTGDEIDFEAAEKAAKEEAEHISKLGYNPNEDAAPVSAASNVTVHKLASTSTTSNSTASSNVSAPKTEEVRKKFVKLGFGADFGARCPLRAPRRAVALPHARLPLAQQATALLWPSSVAKRPSRRIKCLAATRMTPQPKPRPRPGCRRLAAPLPSRRHRTLAVTKRRSRQQEALVVNTAVLSVRQRKLRIACATWQTMNSAL